ncbi:hypothetical protein F2Q68_00042441 [Brassica cretica]|uniref:Pentacotripeptide-repeat region of PRORP domain-containing protein n=1 Tax=Brassica cretica TaxID=69181 RepID=A0A8S9MI81_BRACR|nr:hypothetical protein F2Q68_00042441 [Brassica cretica]
MIRIRSAKALRSVRPLLLETAGTLRTSLFHRTPYELLSFVCERGFSSGRTSGRNLCYRERLRSGLVGIKKDDAVALFQTMIESRPRPTVIDFNRLFTALARTKQSDLVLDLCKQMELQGIAHNIYTLSIVINCFCRRRKLGFAFSVMGKMLKLGYEPGTVTFSTLINGLCLQGRVSEAVDFVDRMVGMKVIPNLIILCDTFGANCLWV